MSIWLTADRLLSGNASAPASLGTRLSSILGCRTPWCCPTFIGEHHAKDRTFPLVFERGRRGRSVLHIDLSGFTRYARHDAAKRVAERTARIGEDRRVHAFRPILHGDDSRAARPVQPRSVVRRELRQPG